VEGSNLLGSVRGLFSGEAGLLARLIPPFVCFSAFLAVAIEFGVDALMFGGKNWILFWMFEALALSAI